MRGYVHIYVDKKPEKFLCLKGIKPMLDMGNLWAI